MTFKVPDGERCPGCDHYKGHEGSALTCEPLTYDQVSALLRASHECSVGGNVWWSWSCSCGRQGAQTSQGRAIAGRDRHLQAERRRIRRERMSR